MTTPRYSTTIKFDDIGSAREWASMMDLKMVRKLPETFVGSGYGDDGERISIIMRKSGINEFEVMEYVH